MTRSEEVAACRKNELRRPSCVDGEIASPCMVVLATHMDRHRGAVSRGAICDLNPLERSI